MGGIVDVDSLVVTDLSLARS